MPITVIRTLDREFHIESPDATTHRAVEFARASPEMPGRSLSMVDLGVEHAGAFYRLKIPGDALYEGTLTHIVHRLHRYLFRLTFEEAGRCPLLHAASIVIDGKRVLLSADKGSGKSTLALRLLGDGVQVEGDENVVVFGSEIIARPRTLRIKQASLALLPEFRDRVLAAPSLTDWNDTRIYSVSPVTADNIWEIRQGPVFAIVFLTANFGGRSVARPISVDEATRRALEQSFLPDQDKARSASRLRALVRSACCYEMSLGDWENARWHLKHIANRATIDADGTGGIGA